MTNRLSLHLGIVVVASIAVALAVRPLATHALMDYCEGNVGWGAAKSGCGGSLGDAPEIAGECGGSVSYNVNLLVCKVDVQQCAPTERAIYLEPVPALQKCIDPRGNPNGKSFNAYIGYCTPDPTCVATPPTPPTPPPPTADIVANPASVVAGNSSMLTWASTNATSCSIDQAIGTVSLNGNTRVTPSQSVTYTLTCTGAGGTATDSATVTVTRIPAPTVTLTASPVSILEGQTSVLTWSSTNATSCTSSTFNTSGATSGQTNVSPPRTAMYSVTCTGPGGKAVAETQVFVMPLLSGACSVSPDSLSVGGTATWTAVATGGTGIYAYVWKGSGGLSGTGPSVAKTYNNAGTYTGSVTITSGLQSATYPCNNTVTVIETERAPDLVAGETSVSSAPAGSPSAFTATASNIGAGNAASFPVLFQIESGALFTSSYLSGLASGASAPASASHTFSVAGDYRVRACANYTTSWTTVVKNETNEANNCGPWTAITVDPPPPDPPLSCSVSDTSPALGDTVTYRVSGGSAPFTWTPSDGVGRYGSERTATRTFNTVGSYGMRVSASGARSGNCPVVVVGRDEPKCTNPDATISANPDRVRRGSRSTITWSATGVSSCTITGPGVSETVSGLFCVVPNGRATPTINAQSVYRISCDGGKTEDEVVVNIIPEYEEF